MNRERLKKWRALPVLVFAASLWSCLPGAGAEIAQANKPAGSEKIFLSWKSPAKLRHVAGGEKGDISIGTDGIEFRSAKGRTVKVPYLEVQTFQILPHRLTIETYQNRKLHMPGIERYRFNLTEIVSPEVAAALAREVQRPSQNAVPDTASQGITILAHHRTLTGGTNGVLRFRDGGIDYVTEVAGDSRSWRWADLQTLSTPDPYHLLVFGYRDTYTFDLKEILPQSLFYRLVDALDSQNAAEPGMNTPSLKGSEKHGLGVGDE